MTVPHGITIFNRLSGEAYDSLQSRIRWKSYGRDAEIISHRNESTDVYFVRQGHVRSILYSRSDREVTFRDFFTGDTFGELSALDGQPRSASVVAIEHSEVGVMSSEDFVEAVLSHPEVSHAVMLELVSTIRGLTERVYRYDTLIVRDRVRKEVLRLARRYMVD